jgi:hypothetical protein
MSDDLSWISSEARERQLAWERKFKALGISRALVQKKVRVSFPHHKESEVLALLDEYGPASWHGEKDRVHLAILKLAAGKVELLRQYLAEAKEDFREVVTPAESPGFWKLGVQGFVIWEQMTMDQQKDLLDADWKQYEEWIRSDQSPGT